MVKSSFLDFDGGGVLVGKDKVWQNLLEIKKKQLFNGLEVGSIFSNNDVIGGATNGVEKLLGSTVYLCKMGGNTQIDGSLTCPSKIESLTILHRLNSFCSLELEIGGMRRWEMQKEWHMERRRSGFGGKGKVQKCLWRTL